MNLKKITCRKVNSIKHILDKYGVAILEGYFTDDYADEVFNQVKQWMIGLNIGLSKNAKSWTNQNTPLGPRYGMYQTIVSNSPKFWELREKFAPLFSEILQDDNLITSIDGASFYPAKFSNLKSKDWAHIDQTESSDFMCYQSQFVATDTDASFVCTPKSHLYHANVLEIAAKNNPSGNWHKFTDEEIPYLKQMFDTDYQIPIYAKKGSVIFWDSRTIHSAKYQTSKDDTWRAVFYISMRSKSDFLQSDIDTIQKAVTEGLTTNHWGNKIFKPFDRFKQKNMSVIALYNNCARLSYLNNLNQKQLELIGLAESDIEFLKRYTLRYLKNNRESLDYHVLKKTIIETKTKKYLYKILCYMFRKTE